MPRSLTVNHAEVAQLVEHSPEKAGVDSSILSLGTIPQIPFSIAEQATGLLHEQNGLGHVPLGSREK